MSKIFKNCSSESIGEMIIMAEVILFALFPVLINYTSKAMPPILYAGLSSLAAAAALFIFLALQGKISDLFNKKALKYILGVTLFIIIIPSILIYTGSSHTSGINTTIFLQIETLFTFLIIGTLTHEKITRNKILGGLAIAIGAITVLYNGQFTFNGGDLLIIAGTVFYPFGNICAKKALKMISPAAILFVRSLLGGTALILISLLFETYTQSATSYLTGNLKFILLNGLLIYALSKLMWYEGFKRMDISKSIPLGMTYPAFSLIYAYLLLKEIPSPYQTLGFLVIFTGILIITKKDKKAIISIAD